MEKVTVGKFFTTFFGGIWQAIKWIVGMLGYKDGTTFSKVVKCIFAVCVTSLLLLFTVVYYMPLRQRWFIQNRFIRIPDIVHGMKSISVII